MKTGFLLAAALIAVATPAHAADFSFTGVFRADNDKVFFDFTANGSSTITLRSFSYAGGVNAAGMTIERGGFDPILSLYDLSTGLLIRTVDDGPDPVPADVVTNARFDTNFSQMIAAGSYRVFITQFNNFGPGTLGAPFPFDGNPDFRGGFIDATGNRRNGNWAFDVLGVETATMGGVPEPTSWALMIGGFGMAGGALRRRRVTVAYA